MADIIKGAYGASLANLRPAGVSSLKVKLAADAAYYSLGNVQDGKYAVNALSKPDTLGREQAYGAEIDITLPSIQAALVELELLDNLITQTSAMAFKIGLIDGLTIATTSKFGLRWKIDCGADMDNFRRIEYLISGAIFWTELDALITSSPPADGTAVNTDILWGITTSAAGQSPVVGDQRPNGLSKIEFKAKGDSDWEDFGDFFDAKYTFECLGNLGGGGRRMPRTSAIKFTFDAQGNETSLTQIHLIDAVAQNQIELKLTHMDGVILTLSNDEVAAFLSLNGDGNADMTRTMKIHASGIIPITDPSTFGTTWGGLWS